MSDQNECVVPIEELCAMKTDGRVGRTCDDDQIAEIDIISADDAVEELKKLVKAEIQQTTTDAPCPRARPPKIQKAPFILRDRTDFDKYYKPRVVSIGPIHYGEKKLCLAEWYKRKLAAAFINRSGKEMEALYKIINSTIKELREFYDEEVIRSHNDKILSWILFLDGCSILMFIYIYTREGDQLKNFEIKTDHVAFIQHDLFLLENQIPFQVLRLLMNATPCRFATELKESIKKFIRTSVMAPPECKNNFTFDIDKLDPIHLLDLLQQVLQLEGPFISRSRPRELQVEQTFRSIQELKAAGINLKQSKSCSLKDITFNSSFFSGCLSLPPLIVDDSTRPKFLNLIAYECCPDNFRTNYEVTTYISFMDSLIDHANDVKELRSAKILRNLLGSDKEVASLFNEMATDLVPNGELYKDVKNSIQSHYDSKRMTWMAEAYHAHFSSPWTFMAFIAALIALALTGIQAWFAAFPRSDDPCSSCCDCTRKT